MLIFTTMYKVGIKGFREQGFRSTGCLALPLCVIGPSVISVVGDTVQVVVVRKLRQVEQDARLGGAIFVAPSSSKLGVVPGVFSQTPMS